MNEELNSLIPVGMDANHELSVLLYKIHKCKIFMNIFSLVDHNEAEMKRRITGLYASSILSS